jgi:hypothetical protein
MHNNSNWREKRYFMMTSTIRVSTEFLGTFA